jgi:hypothetical protein
VDATQDPLSGLKNVFQNNLKGISKNLMDTRGSILPSIADKTKHKVEKQCVNK